MPARTSSANVARPPARDDLPLQRHALPAIYALREFAEAGQNDVGKKFVSKRNSIARDLVACLQEPTAESAGNLMQGVAGRCCCTWPS
jgi:hypothetical protein